MRITRALTAEVQPHDTRLKPEVRSTQSSIDDLYPMVPLVLYNNTALKKKSRKIQTMCDMWKILVYLQQNNYSPV